PIKHSTENFYSKNVESNPALKIKLTPYRRPISTANATPPKKGILKPPPPPNTRSLWKRDWLSTLNIRLQNAANSASTTEAPNTTASFFSSALKRLNSPTTFSYITQQEELQQMPQQNQKQPPHVNPTTPADQISQYNSQNSSLSSNTNLLTPKALKRVRFSVAKLTDEYPHSPIPGESDNSDWEDEYDFREWNEKQKKTSQTLPEAEQKRVYTPRDMMKFYLAACRNREEFPADRLVDIFKKACQPGGSLNAIDLTGDIIDKKIAEPIADILTLEFGLQKLIMERCEIEEDTMKIICHSLLVNDSLPYLNLSNNKRLRTNGFNYIAVYIKKSLTLAYLDLSGINIDKKSATFLAQALIQGNNKSGAVLETLNLDNCGLKNNVLEVLGPGIRRSNLRNLSLRFNRINHVGAVWIGVMLRDYEDLNFGTNNAQLSPSMPPFNEQEEARAEKLRSRKRGIEVLNITGNDLRSGIQYIAQALRRNRSLKELHMQENRIDPKGLAILADGLNPVGGPSSEGIIAIRNGLSLNTTLKGLFLSNINLSSEGAIAIAEYLPETNSLVHLDLTSNPDIDIAGVLALAVSIKMNHSVRVLDVNVQPNDNEMARLSRDILRACVRNTELAQKSDSENSENGFLLADFETKSHSVLSGITGSSDFDESSELSLGIYVEDLKKNVK
ncbi:5083_t:CDS:10, partial [Funneliformis mosseae]